MKGLPSPNDIYSEGQNDISHILTHNIFERAYAEAMSTFTSVIESTPVLPVYGLSYLDVLAQLEAWNQKKKKDQYFYVFS